MAGEAAYEFHEEGAAPVLALRGDWTVDTIGAVERDLVAISHRLSAGAAIDVSALGRFDVAGAYIIDRAFRGGAVSTADDVVVRGEHASARQLLAAARDAQMAPAEPPKRLRGLVGVLDRVGRIASGVWEEVVETTGFFGQVLTVLARLVVDPRRIRWAPMVHAMEVAGLNALAIVSLLSFFIGMVVAYLGARILGDFGAAVFTVELVAFSVLREFAVVITAVLLAGRTNSAFTAEIGAMKMRQEIDAMDVIGIDPMEALVAPRVIAMLVMTPILTFAAMMAGIVGGVLVCWAELGVSPQMFFARISETVPTQHFWVGMSKAPVFAVVLAVIGCKQGLSVGGDVASLGSRVTTSVVQSIFMIILLDALFALWFLEMDW